MLSIKETSTSQNSSPTNFEEPKTVENDVRKGDSFQTPRRDGTQITDFSSM